jgi:hypothetical protein
VITMGEPGPLDDLDEAELASRARIHSGVGSDAAGSDDIKAVSSALNELLLERVLPEGVRLKLPRSVALRFLGVFADRQNNLDSAMVATIALLLEYCKTLEARIDDLSAQIGAAGSVGSNKGCES